MYVYKSLLTSFELDYEMCCNNYMVCELLRELVHYIAYNLLMILAKAFVIPIIYSHTRQQWMELHELFMKVSGLGGIIFANYCLLCIHTQVRALIT